MNYTIVHDRHVKTRPWSVREDGADGRVLSTHTTDTAAISAVRQHATGEGCSVQVLPVVDARPMRSFWVELELSYEHKRLAKIIEARSAREAAWLFALDLHERGVKGYLVVTDRSVICGSRTWSVRPDPAEQTLSAAA